MKCFSGGFKASKGLFVAGSQPLAVCRQICFIGGKEQAPAMDSSFMYYLTLSVVIDFIAVCL